MTEYELMDSIVSFNGGDWSRIRTVVYEAGMLVQ
jgi:hypothetical protein